VNERMGELLVKENLISAEQLRKARDEAKTSGGRLGAQITRLGEQIKKGVREVRLTVAWKDGKRDESFTVVTHMVVLAPREPGA